MALTLVASNDHPHVHRAAQCPTCGTTEEKKYIDGQECPACGQIHCQACDRMNLQSTEEQCVYCGAPFEEAADAS